MKTKTLSPRLLRQMDAHAMVSCLVVNAAAKVAMIKWRVPTAVD